jgi:hypothetical protein
MESVSPECLVNEACVQETRRGHVSRDEPCYVYTQACAVTLLRHLLASSSPAS